MPAGFMLEHFVNVRSRILLEIDLSGAAQSPADITVEAAGCRGMDDAIPPMHRKLSEAQLWAVSQPKMTGEPQKTLGLTVIMMPINSTALC